MSSTYSHRFYKQQKQNDIKFKKVGQTRMLMICLNYEGTSSPLTCTIDGKRIINEAKQAGVTDIVAIFDDNTTQLFPTRQTVVNQMAKIASSCQQGDMFVLYYSGHGTSVQDLNHDEQDGKDEAFCLMSESGQYQFLTDDDIANIISKSLPDNVPCLFIVDACHSGSILDLSNGDVWGDKKVYSISGCQDNQYSNDTGNGGQMTNILLAVIRENKHARLSNQLSLQYIFNRMITKNQEIEGKYSDPQEIQEAYEKLEKNSGPGLFDLCFGTLKLCLTKDNIQASDYMDIMGQVMDFNDAEGEFDPVNEKAVDGQWINLAWNGGSDPTKIPFPF